MTLKGVRVWMSKQKVRLISDLPRLVNRTIYSLLCSVKIADGRNFAKDSDKEFVKIAALHEASSCSCNSESRFGCTNWERAINDVVRQRSRVNNASSSTSFNFRGPLRLAVANLVNCWTLESE